jgi:hypothetical protein
LTTVQEKLDRETGRKIYLYKQGVFWTAYEQSALILSRHKPLKISIRFVKTVNRKVISVGFPDATLGFFNDIFGPFVETDKHTGYFELNGTEEGIDLAALREEVLQQLADEIPEPSNRPTDLKEQILAFRLAEKTPMEAMMFVQKLQDSIRQEAGR